MRRLVLVLIFSQSVLANGLSEKVAEVTNRPEYRHARWGLLVVDAATGTPILERNADQIMVPASTTKLFSCAAALMELGSDYRFKTRVVTDRLLVDGSVFGNVTLIASGDPTMGGRTMPDGTMAFANGDHTYADPHSTAAEVTKTDPLAGLTDLARQVKKAGVNEIRGDVIIDDRLFEPARSTGSGPELVTPIVINDNVIDFLISNRNGVVRVETRPACKLIQWDTQVVVGGVHPYVAVTAEGPWRYSLRGNVPAKDATYVRAVSVPEPVTFARSLFIECLEREGVKLHVSALGRPQASLADERLAGSDRVLAVHLSPPLHELVKVTLKVSHNLYGSMLPSLIAAKVGKRNAADGLAIQGKILRELGVDTNAVAFAGGAGGAPADSASPRAVVSLLQKINSLPELAAIEPGLPVMGVDGTLATSLPVGSPARGQVRAKTGTLFWVDPVNDRLLLRSKALAGVMTAKNGKKLLFAIFLNDVPLRPGATPGQEGEVLAHICEIIHDCAP